LVRFEAYAFGDFLQAQNEGFNIYIGGIKAVQQLFVNDPASADPISSTVVFSSYD
jgi:hypothetical protein